MRTTLFWGHDPITFLVSMSHGKKVSGPAFLGNRWGPGGVPRAWKDFPPRKPLPRALAFLPDGLPLPFTEAKAKFPLKLRAKRSLEAAAPLWGLRASRPGGAALRDVTPWGHRDRPVRSGFGSRPRGSLAPLSVSVLSAIWAEGSSGVPGRKHPGPPAPAPSGPCSESRIPPSPPGAGRMWNNPCPPSWHPSSLPGALKRTGNLDS